MVFPLEFVVAGRPASLQTKSSKSRSAWRTKVREASFTALSDDAPAILDPVAITLLYFPGREMRGDLDNIVKPVLDALCKRIYIDDQQVHRIWVQKFEPGRIYPFGNPSGILAGAIGAPKPLLFIRVTDQLTEGLA